MKSKKEYKKDIKRAITVLIIGMIIAVYLIVNADDSFQAGVVYSILGAVSIGGYLIWDKF